MTSRWGDQPIATKPYGYTYIYALNSSSVQYSVLHQTVGNYPRRVVFGKEGRKGFAALNSRSMRLCGEACYSELMMKYVGCNGWDVIPNVEPRGQFQALALPARHGSKRPQPWKRVGVDRLSM